MPVRKAFVANRHKKVTTSGGGGRHRPFVSPVCSNKMVGIILALTIKTFK